MTIPFTKRVQGLPSSAPFVGPETLEREHGQRFAARIGANESAFGISPVARKAMQDAMGDLSCSWYGDPENYDLRSALAERFRIPMECICVDAGIDSLLGLSVRMFMEPGDQVVTSDGAYPTFNYHVSGFGGELNKVPYNNYHEDPETLLDAAKKSKARLIYFANPDNPMGTWHDAATVQNLIDHTPDHSILLLDEAYTEFSTDDIAPPIDSKHKRVIRFRTFSKAYGMAGMRIGYAIAHPDIITGFNKIRNHFAVNRLAQVAALASIEDSNAIPEALKKVQTGRQRIYSFANKNQLEYLPSATNFVAVDLLSSERANSMLAGLNGNGVFIRMPGVAPLNRFIRVGIGTEEEQAVFEEQFNRLAEKLPIT